ncbi:MAG: hypothetical protein A3C22_00240 [Candidatus Levybacteria bacterium RIFCSPHIGHO2_02_FULL_37_10]|uniref:Uncharacterized protein n=1 Tax=Candidatus Portnoybacteria bacterium RIFCSPHIGHO2_01_FULL_40_12b TaxID=1801994 RepID=A0A1G2FBF8_9BACT|nr:MAG: hypothetical protein A3C22_00240 [Candidatus Levybacteria bacterium RIFCSPHIGHO2_02_FULL_37_10]OGH42595.1 MAG: hypothetical protein A3H79_02505 [Candidatus Levybacteria bacterium RIFCSPLOWO2_02_FULL_36_8b]OGZ35102.1 MAG: hypothetical protein A2815_02095 [Candidatus Portnoybacteria bacterium RIFCSPHIGHO2_01_FULL_40_12b]
MVEQGDKSSQVAEITPKLSPQEKFITDLYQKTLDWLTSDQQGKITAVFNPQEISSWKQHDGRHPGEISSISIGLEKGVIVETKDRIFALVMGRELNSRYSRERTLSFQFGCLPIDSALARQDKNLDLVRMLTQQRMWTHGSGEFFVHDMTGEVTIHCWADGWNYSGGKEIGRWPQEEVLTDKGLNACLDIIQRTSKNAFIR